MSKVKVDLSRLGIIDLDQKRALECYVDERLFTQRKTYAEYYLDKKDIELSLGIRDLMILADNFSVSVHGDSVVIEEY